MKRIVIEIDGVRHQLVPDQKNVDHCMKGRCSMYAFCQRAPVTTCTAFATSGYHFSLLADRLVVHNE